MSSNIVRIGSLLYGYCGGYFGHSHENKRVEAIGADWVVAREVDSGRVQFEDVCPEDLVDYLEEKTDG